MLSVGSFLISLASIDNSLAVRARVLSGSYPGANLETKDADRTVELRRVRAFFSRGVYDAV